MDSSMFTFSYDVNSYNGLVPCVTMKCYLQDFTPSIMQLSYLIFIHMTLI